MTKTKSNFVCQECGFEVTKWVGKCPDCNSWNTFEVEGNISSKQNKSKKPLKISEIEKKKFSRIETNIGEFDRVMGGGITEGSLTLIGGEPGIGKSTLLMEVCGKITNLYKQSTILYVTGEESSMQVATRCKRLGIEENNFLILNETNWQNIVEVIKSINPEFFILDSIQTAVSSEIQSSAGSVTQVKEVTFELMRLAKDNSMTCFIVGHVNKGGAFAGPKVLEHMVDTAIHFEGDQYRQNRILRVIKNRFGSTDEVGLFEMTENGLTEIKQASMHFIETTKRKSFGRSLTCILEGNRPLFVEIQALVNENNYGNGKKTTQGVDHNRLSLLVAVIEKYFKIPLSLHDIYLNVVGDIKLESRESDLSIIVSLLSSFYGKSISDEVVFIGEVGLTGEIRPIKRIESRLKELEQLNFKKIYLSNENISKMAKVYNMEIIGISNACELEAHIF